MAVQASLNVITAEFVKDGNGYVKPNETFLQDAGRGTAILYKGTVVSKIAASGKWVPFTDETATDGSQIPAGVVLEDIPAASLVAGDVLDIPVLCGAGCTVDENLLIIENSLTLATVVTVPVNIALTVEDCLQIRGIYMALTVDIDEYENA